MPLHIPDGFFIALHYISVNFLAIRNSTTQNSESGKESSIAIIQWPNLPNQRP